MRNRLILINGKKRSGKNFTAELLLKKLEKNGYSSKIMSLAEPLKKLIAKTFNISFQEVEKYKNNFVEIFMNGDSILNMRELLQRFGNEAMKEEFGKDIWIKKLLERIEIENIDVDYIIVPDFRYEIEHIENSITLKIWHDELERNNRDYHPSEIELDNFNFDHTIDNSQKDSEQLEISVDQFIVKFIK